MSLATALSTLANYRSHNTRASQDIFDKGSVVLKSGGASRLGDNWWDFLEQLALASIDVGRLEVADECIHLLLGKFPESPRVDVLAGIRMEASESPAMALAYYDGLLETDPSSAVFWKRRISVLRRMGKVEKTVEELNQFLDTFYNDVDAWNELADIYAECNQYTSSLQALSHLLLLNPQNSFYFLKFAETAYTSGDLPLSLKMFLIVLDMCEREEEIAKQPPTGIAIRAWFGVKQSARKLLATPNPHSHSQTPIPQNVELLDQLATERILEAYSGKDMSGKSALRAWLGSQ
jgi:tetratricopeptide (TPR) repeat protein